MCGYDSYLPTESLALLLEEESDEESKEVATLQAASYRRRVGYTTSDDLTNQQMIWSL